MSVRLAYDFIFLFSTSSFEGRNVLDSDFCFDVTFLSSLNLVIKNR